MTKKISFCVTCMGRIDFLKKTLLHNLKLISKYPECEIVLLDYNSKDGLKQWIYNNYLRYISDGLLVYCHTTEPETFHMSHAKNLSHRLGSGEILCNLDADNFLSNHYIEEVVSLIGNDNFILKARADGKGAGGRIAVSSDLFYKVRGYEEHIDRWGHDDTDFFNKCEVFAGKAIGYLKPIMVIGHDDNIRGRNYDKPFNRKKSREWECTLKNRIKNGKLHSNLNRTFGKGIVEKNFKDSVIIESEILDKEYEFQKYRLVYSTGLANMVFVYPELGTFIMTIVKHSIHGLNNFWFDKGYWVDEGDKVRMKWFWHGEQVLDKIDDIKYACDHYKLKRKK